MSINLTCGSFAGRPRSRPVFDLSPNDWAGAKQQTGFETAINTTNIDTLRPKGLTLRKTSCSTWWQHPTFSIHLPQPLLHFYFRKLFRKGSCLFSMCFWENSLHVAAAKFSVNA